MDWRVSGGSVTSLEEQQADFIWSIPNSIGKVPKLLKLLCRDWVQVAPVGCRPMRRQAQALPR